MMKEAQCNLQVVEEKVKMLVYHLCPVLFKQTSVTIQQHLSFLLGGDGHHESKVSGLGTRHNDLSSIQTRTS